MMPSFHVNLSDAHAKLATDIGHGDLSSGLALVLQSCRLKPLRPISEAVILAVLERFGTAAFNLAAFPDFEKGPLWLELEKLSNGTPAYALRSCKGTEYCGYRLIGKMDRRRRAIWQLIEVIPNKNPA